MSKHLSEDEVTLTVNAKAEKAQQNIRTFSKEIDRLGERNKSLQRQMESLEVAGKKDTESWKQRRAEYGKNAAQIRTLKKQIADETKALDINSLTMSQLRKQAKALQRELDNTSKSINPAEWSKLSDRLTEVKSRMHDLSDASKGLVEKYTNPQTMSFLRGELFIRLGELIGKAAAKVSDFAAEGINMAESADGVIHAFRQLDKPALLDNLRKATKGTVSDIELMKAAVKARDFNIPLEDLGKYLSFAQLKAQQTGQSLDYMVDSIVTGLGRKSPMILDNLGLSAAEISEKTKETGDFMKGVASIVEKNLAQAGETYISAADRATQKTTTLQNKQLELGEALLPLKEEASEVFGSMKMGIIDCIIWLATHRKATIALSLALTALTISMTVLNAAFRAWIVQTTLAKVVIAGWTSTATTLKGIYLLVAAAINTMSGNTVRATAMMRLFNASCKSNVILLLVTALVAAGVAIYSYMNKTAEAKKATVNFNLELSKVASDIKKQTKEIDKAVNKSTASEITKIKNLQSTIHDTSKSYNQRKKAILDMQSIVPGYHASITKEGKLFNENTTAIDTYIKNLRRAARAEAAYERMKANEAKILDAEDRISDSNTKIKNVKTNTKNKYGMNFDEMNIQDDGLVRYNDVHRKDNPHLLDDTKVNYRWDPGANAEQIKANQDFIEKKTALVAKDKEVVSMYSKQNDKLQKIIDDNGGINQKFSPKNLNHSTSGTPKKDSPDEIASKRFSHDRSQDLEEAKQAYNEDLNALKEALAEKRLTKEQYSAYVSALDIQHQNNLLMIEKSYQIRSQKMAMKDAAKKKAIVETQSKAVADQQQAVNNAYLEAEKLFYDALDRMKATAPAAPQTLQQECNDKLRALEGYYQASLQLAKDDAQQQLQATKAYEAAKAAITADYAKKAEDEKTHTRQEFGLDTFEDQYETQAKKRKEAFDKGIIDKQQYDQAIANLDQQAEEHRLQIRQQYGLVTQQELYNAELEQLKMHLQNKEISETEYEEAIKNLKIAKAKEAFDYYANLTSGAMQALMQAEEANVDAKYDAEIEAARNAGKDTTEIEKKKANEKLKIQKKYADINFAIQAAQIIASTAAAIAKTFADLGFPAGIPAAVLMSVTGTAQLAAALAERNKVKKMTMQGDSAATASGSRVATGLESGGSIDIEREQDGRLFHAAYDPSHRGFVEKPTVIVGEGPYGHSREWVASNAAVENPTIAPIIDIIDRAQRAGTIRTLDMNKFLLQQAQGKAEGGVINSVSNPTQPLSNGSYRDSLIERLANVLNRLADDGISAAVTLDDIERKQQLRDRARKFGSK